MYGYVEGWHPLEMLRRCGGFPLDRLEEIEARFLCGESVDAAMQSVLCEMFEEEEKK